MRISVEVVFGAGPDESIRYQVWLPAGATVWQAIEESGVRRDFARIGQIRSGDVAVYGRRVTLETPLKDGDRVEVLRPLLADPKEARRRRTRTTPHRRSGIGPDC